MNNRPGKYTDPHFTLTNNRSRVISQGRLILLIKSKTHILLVVVICVGLLSVASWAIQFQIQHEAKNEIEQSLTAVLHSTHQAVRSWVKEHRTATMLWANTPRMKNFTKNLLEVPPTQSELIASPAQLALRSWLRPVHTGDDYLEYSIVSLDGINLASSRDVNVGVVSLLTRQKGFLNKIWSGKAATSLQQLPDAPLADKHGILHETIPTIFVGAPIMDTAGSVIAAFIYRIDPKPDFLTIFRHGRIGDSGETYAFDKYGVVISVSQFNDLVHETGLLLPNLHGIQNVELKNPGSEVITNDTTEIDYSKQSLTHMLSNAIQGEFGSNMHGYPNFKGIMVVGAWLWDSDLDFGIATEISSEDAFQMLQTTEYVISALTVLLGILLIGSTFIIIIDRERRQIQFALRESEDKFKALLESGPDAMVVVNKQGSIVLVNQQTEKLFGYTRAELVGNPMEILLPNHLKHKHRIHRKRFYKVPKLRPMGTKLELLSKHKSGMEIPIEVSLSPLQSNEGVLVSSAIRDITERKQAEHELEKSRARFRNLVEATSDWIWEVDEHAVYTYVSPQIKDLLGYSPAEVLGKTPFDLMPETEALRIKTRFEEIAQKESTFKCLENSNYHKNGELIILETSGVPFFDAGGKLKGYRGIDRDITQRKSAEESLKDSEIRVRLLLESVGEGVFGVDLEGMCTFINPAALRLLRYDKAEKLLGKKIHNLIHHTCHNGALCQEKDCRVYRAFKESQSFYVDDEILWRSDGSSFNVEYRSYPIVRDGSIVGSVATFSDITLRKQSEEKLKQAATVFENTVEAIIISDSDNNIVAVNHAYTQITGYEADEVMGKNPKLHQSGQHNKSFYQNMWSTLHETGHWKGEIWNRRKNGEFYPVWQNISVVTDDQEKIINFISVFSDISVIKESEARLNHLAHHDALTGLPNRLLFIANLDQALEQAKRNHRKMALLYLDLDRFKLINDTLGHNTGDLLLQTIANRVKQCVRAEDTVARLGGDEFTVILTEITHTQDAAVLAGKIIRSIANTVTINGQEVVTSTSIGISVFPEDANNSEDLAKAADAAMYTAKDRGRNTYCFYTNELTERAFEHLLLQNSLRQALAKEEFELYYQPQVNLTSGEIVGVEALIRWHHPEFGLLSPVKFIPEAEESGLIDPINEWVIRTAYCQAKAWHIGGYPSIRMAVNLSGHQVLRKKNLMKVKGILEELKLKPGEILFDVEITENVLQVTDQSLETLNNLKSFGITLAIDDFGKGYSSLSRIKHLPIDTLKIDRTFVEDITSDKDDQAIATAIIAIGHSMNMKVIDEGVENEQQMWYLKRQGCDEMQGFLFSKPLPTGEIAHLLKARKRLNAVLS